MVKVKIDMTGWNMWEHGVPDSRLTVLTQTEDYIDLNGKRKAQWLCECNCPEHNNIIAIGSNLTRGNTLSCGCLQKERAVAYNKKSNIFDLSGEYGVGWTTNTNREFYFDLEDYDKIKDYCWCETTVNYNRNFHTLQAKHPKYGNVKMHQLLGFSNYDHIDRNELNNRKNNLRPCTRSQNQMNQSIRSDNTSGVTGVSLRNDGYWEALLVVDGVKKFRKAFQNKDDAIRARLNAEVKYFGDFAPQQHLYEQYGISTPQND
jgi:hypothetical protein